MPTSIAELLPSFSELSPADKFQLVQIVLQQLAAEQGIKKQKKACAEFSNTTPIRHLSIKNQQHGSTL
jgi:hypothetical protein